MSSVIKLSWQKKKGQPYDMERDSSSRTCLSVAGVEEFPAHCYPWGGGGGPPVSVVLK